MMEQKYKPLVVQSYVDLVAVVQVEEERQKKRVIGEELEEDQKSKLEEVAVAVAKEYLVVLEEQVLKIEMELLVQQLLLAKVEKEQKLQVVEQQR